LLTDLEGKNVEELCALGQEKLMKGAAVSAAAAAPAASAAAPAAAEKPKEKPKVEEVDALDGGMSMFGSSGGAKDY
jgi:ribosomal protein L12E/L44/L45/RPP1/RPP2